MGSASNLKITYPDDLLLAAAIMAVQHRSPQMAIASRPCCDTARRNRRALAVVDGDDRATDFLQNKKPGIAPGFSCGYRDRGNYAVWMLLACLPFGPSSLRTRPSGLPSAS
jgi:hypothetical protein